MTSSTRSTTRTRRTALALVGGVVLTTGGALALPSVATAEECAPLQTSVTVDRGDSGPAVAAVQCALRVATGNEFVDLSVDGRFGSDTEYAVTTFQARWDLSADGVVGPATYRVLAERAADPRPDGDLPGTQPEGPSDVAHGPTLRRGDTGEAVRVLQRALGVAADGRFGPVTERSVMAFQGRQGLLVDGVVGPRTRESLARNGVDGY